MIRADLYAVAALAGAATVVGGSLLNLPIILTTLGGDLVCFGLRVMAIRRGWHLPVARENKDEESSGASDRDPYVQ
ncbi:hypothetical protein SAMN02927924_03937 [Sphingobium faniae]|nr:hypothetical protein SAMN02927924_03937 [Sphingobium faniae]